MLIRPAWINKHNHSFLYDVTTHSCQTSTVHLNTVEIRSWMNNSILLFYNDVITYSCPIEGSCVKDYPVMGFTEDSGTWMNIFAEYTINCDGPVVGWAFDVYPNNPFYATVWRDLGDGGLELIGKNYIEPKRIGSWVSLLYNTLTWKCHHFDFIWSNVGLLGTHFSKILIKINQFSFEKMHLKISSAKFWYFQVSPTQCVNSLRPSDAYMRE